MPELHCASETRQSRAFAARLLERPWRQRLQAAAPWSGPPSETHPERVEETRDGTESNRVRLRDLEARVRGNWERARGARDKPVPIEIRVRDERVQSHILQAVVLRIDGEPLAARTDLDGAWPSAPVSRLELAPGIHVLAAELVLRADYRGGFFDYVGHCVRTEATFEFIVPSGSPPIQLDAIASQPDERPFARPSLRFQGAQSTGIEFEDD